MLFALEYSFSTKISLAAALGISMLYKSPEGKVHYYWKQGASRIRIPEAFVFQLRRMHEVSNVFSDIADMLRFCSQRQHPLPRDTNTTRTLWLFRRKMCTIFHFTCTLLVANARWLFGRPTQWMFPVQLISGAIPNTIGQLTNLTNLYLYNNQLTGESTR